MPQVQCKRCGKVIVGVAMKDCLENLSRHIDFKHDYQKVDFFDDIDYIKSQKGGVKNGN